MNSNNNCLYECKEQICACIKESSLKVNSDDIVNALTQEISINKFRTWLKTNEPYFITKEYQHSYFKKAFMNELEKGTFCIDPVIVKTASLIQAMRNKGIKVTNNSSLYLEAMVNEAYRSGMSAEDINMLNERIVAYMKEEHNFDDFVTLFKKSNTTRPYKINWQKIEEKYQEDLKHWEELFSGIDSIRGDKQENEMSWEEIMSALCPEETR